METLELCKVNLDKTMRIISGNVIKNRTYKYLFPVLKTYGGKLQDYLNSFYKLAVGIGDNNYKSSDDCLYILFDVNYNLAGKKNSMENRAYFEEFITWLKNQSFYKTDYMYDISGVNCYHMVVIKIPEEYLNAYSNFLQGKYSQMYTDKQISKLFDILNNDTNVPGITIRNSRVKECRDVFKRTPSRLKEFVEIVNKEFGTQVSEEHFKDAELDFPIKVKEEIFNF